METASKLLKVFVRMAHALLFYPVMIGLFAWLYFTKANWVWGALVILAILILDPIWRTMGGTAIHKFKNRK